MATEAPIRRQFRFGVVAAQAGSGDEWTAKAKRIESLGYATLLMPDGIRYTWSPLPALAAAAAVTRSLRLGTYVLANDFRNPVEVAKEAATLDVISGGRFELGLGAGRPAAADDNRMLGLPFDAASVRIERVAEALALIGALLSGASATATGPHYAVEGAEIQPLPVQGPRPPLLVAGWSRRMLEVAAREADIVALGMPPTTTPATMSERIDLLRELAGPRFSRIELNVNLMAVGDRVPAFIAHQMRLSAADLAGSATALLGTPDQMCEALLRRRETLGLSYIVVSEELMDALAPVVERLAGR